MPAPAEEGAKGEGPDREANRRAARRQQTRQDAGQNGVAGSGHVTLGMAHFAQRVLFTCNDRVIARAFQLPSNAFIYNVFFVLFPLLKL